MLGDIYIYVHIINDNFFLCKIATASIIFSLLFSLDFPFCTPLLFCWCMKETKLTNHINPPELWGKYTIGGRIYPSYIGRSSKSIICLTDIPAEVSTLPRQKVFRRIVFFYILLNVALLVLNTKNYFSLKKPAYSDPQLSSY